MSRRHRPLRIAFLDTNFYSYLHKNPNLARHATSYLTRQGLTVIISIMHWAELHEATKQHESIGRFWDDVGAQLVAPSGITNYLALEAYPHVSRVPPRVLGPICEEIARNFLAGIPVVGSPTGFTAAVLSDRLSEQKPNARDTIDEIRRRWPEATTRQDFEDRWIHHHLTITSPTRLHPNFLNLDFPLVPGSFPSLRLQGALVWWSHVRAKAIPPRFEESELGDRGHSEYFYCCELIILERFQHQMVCELRRSAPQLFSTSLKTLTTSDFVKLLSES